MSLCDPWTTQAELVLCGCPDNLLNSEYVDDMIQAAGELLDRWTYERFGICTTTERPCAPCSCNPTSCICSGWDVVELTYGPISGTPAVTIDGAAFTSFEVLAPNMLHRTDGQGWPSCNSLESGQGWSVTYNHGTAVPQIGRQAASALAVELLKTCPGGGGECALPPGTVQLNQRGATVRIDPEQAGKALPQVGMFLQSWGRPPAGVTRLDASRNLITTYPV